MVWKENNHAESCVMNEYDENDSFAVGISWFATVLFGEQNDLCCSCIMNWEGVVLNSTIGE